jgi:hypothetical protein
VKFDKATDGGESDSQATSDPHRRRLTLHKHVEHRGSQLRANADPGVLNTKDGVLRLVLDGN